MNRKIQILFLALFCSITMSKAQQLPVGPQVLTFFSDADDTEQPYGLYLPKNYDANKKYPLVVMLHGAGDNHRLSLRRVFGKSNANGETDVEATRYFPEWKDVEYIVATPYSRGTMGYQGVAEKDIYDVLAEVKKRFNIDEDRTYLTGLSMGGGGSLWIGLSRPDIWAAIAPVCPAPPNGTDEFAPNALNVPMHFFHGDKDPAVPVSVSRDWTKKLKESGTNVTYTEYPGVGHNSWENAYANGQIFDWFSKFKRDAHPARVRFVTKNYQYNHAYWVAIDKIIPGVLAELDVKFTAPNTLEITTAHLPAFTLNLAGHPQYKAGQSLIVTIDGKKVKAQSTDVVSFKLDRAPKARDMAWVNSKYELPATDKKAGAEGPLGAAFSTRHVYVYGTGGNPTPAELNKRREVAEEAANWSVYRGAFLGRLMFYPRVLSDKEIRPSDFESCNLVLFGTKETNSVIEKYSDRLPVHLQTTATNDHGLFYIFPIDGHYVAICSGLPWWTGQSIQGFRFMPTAVMQLMDFKDFILFKGAVGNVVAEGYFDNSWNLPEAEKGKIKASGVTLLEN